MLLFSNLRCIQTENFLADVLLNLLSLPKLLSCYIFHILRLYYRIKQNQLEHMLSVISLHIDKFMINISRHTCNYDFLEFVTGYPSK